MIWIKLVIQDNGINGFSYFSGGILQQKLGGIVIPIRTWIIKEYIIPIQKGVLKGNVWESFNAKQAV